jgi:hypothetical protein
LGLVMGVVARGGWYLGIIREGVVIRETGSLFFFIQQRSKRQQNGNRNVKIKKGTYKKSCKCLELLAPLRGLEPRTR